MEWIKISNRVPDNRSRVLVFFLNEYNKGRISIAEYIAFKTVLAEDFLDPDCDGFQEYDEKKDCYWTPAGFYESQYATDINYFLGNEKITHWMELPKCPQILNNVEADTPSTTGAGEQNKQ